MYVLLSTTIATAGPERVGSAFGVPVPRRTTWLRGAGREKGGCAALDIAMMSTRRGARDNSTRQGSMEAKVVFVGRAVKPN